MAAIKGIIFDKDGTLFDFQATWGAWSRIVLTEESDGDPGLMTRLAEVMGYDPGRGLFHPDSMVIGHTNEEIARALLPILPGNDLVTLMQRMDRRAMMAPQVEATPLVPLLTRLRGMGLHLGIATNDAEAPARAHLARAGVEGMFDFIAGFNSGHGGKPAPGQLLAFCAATRLTPADCVMVGDSLHDLRAGRAAGMTAIAVLTGVATRADLAPHADVVLTSIADLPGWLG